MLPTNEPSSQPLAKSRKYLLNWRHIFMVLLYALPFLCLMVLGLFWLFENGFLIAFFVACLVLSLLSLAIRKFSARAVNPSSKKRATEGSASDAMRVSENPEWSEIESEAFNRARERVNHYLIERREWDSLPSFALDLVREVAKDLGGESKKPLDFSAPEALLLIEKTASRYRAHLRGKVPFSEQLSLSTLYWFWNKRSQMSIMLKVADAGRRLTRFAAHPGGALIRELEEYINKGNAGFVSQQFVTTLQASLLEEVASTAIDLYSGRLRFSDAELLQIELESTQKDAQRYAAPDDPLRVIVVGQTSSGKSTLINNLLQQDTAETDVAATTQNVATYQTVMNDINCHFLDTPGIDGSEKNLNVLLEELHDSDMVLWLLRADRPSRDPDAKLLNAFKAWSEQNPLRRKPVMIFLVSFIDNLIEGWPFEEHMLENEALAKIDDVQNSIAKHMGGEALIPISGSDPVWNIDLVAATMEQNIVEALMVQRNRRRMLGKQDPSLYSNLKSGTNALYHSAKFLGSRWLNHNASKNTGRSNK